MKTIRVILAISAMLLAIGGALASRYASNNTYYEHRVIEGDDVCIPRSVLFTCSTNQTMTICESADAPGVQLKETDTPSTSCGPALWKQP